MTEPKKIEYKSTLELIHKFMKAIESGDPGALTSIKIVCSNGAIMVIHSKGDRKP